MNTIELYNRDRDEDNRTAPKISSMEVFLKSYQQATNQQRLAFWTKRQLRWVLWEELLTGRISEPAADVEQTLLVRIMKAGENPYDVMDGYPREDYDTLMSQIDMEPIERVVSADHKGPIWKLYLNLQDATNFKHDIELIRRDGLTVSTTSTADGTFWNPSRDTVSYHDILFQRLQPNEPGRTRDYMTVMTFLDEAIPLE